MKKLAKLAALLAAAALLFGAAGCSGGDDDPPAKTLEGIKITADDTVKRQYDVGADLGLTGITVTAEYSDNSEEDVTGKAEFTATYKDADGTDKPFDTKTEGIFEVTLTAAYGGKTDSLDPCEITVGDGNPDADLDSIRIDVDEAAVKTEYKQNEAFNLNNLAGITVKAVYKDADGNETEQDVTSAATFTATHGEGEGKEAFDTSLEIGTYEVTLTATFDGETDFVITRITIVENDTEPTDPEPTGTTYAWNFSTSALNDEVDLDANKALEAKVTYESTPAGLTLVLPEGLKLNEVDSTWSSGNLTNGGSGGVIQPNGGSDGANDLYFTVKGAFEVEVLYASNGGEKTNRYAYIKFDGVEAAKNAEGKQDNAGGKLTASYAGEDEVVVSIGGSDYFRLTDIKVSMKAVDAAGRTAGEVISSAIINTAKTATVNNTVDKLGLVGAKAVSDKTNIVTATITDDGIVLTPVGKGTATVTVSDAENHEATIEVSVSGTGTISVKVTPYVDLSVTLESANWVVTCESNNPVVTGDSGLVATFDADGNGGASGNAANFKFGSGKSVLTLTTPRIKAGKKVTLKVTGYSGSSSGGVYSEVDITVNSTVNASASPENVDRVAFPSNEESSGTFAYTVDEDGVTSFTFARIISKTTCITKVEVTVE